MKLGIKGLLILTNVIDNNALKHEEFIFPLPNDA